MAERVLTGAESTEEMLASEERWMENTGETVPEGRKYM